MRDTLKRKVGFFGLTMVAVGSCVGSGIFITPSDIASQLGNPYAILGVWLLGGIVAVTGALTFAELGARFPRAGGVYVYIREAFGHLWAFLYGWCILTVITSGAIAALSLTCARYMSVLVPLDQTGKLIVGATAIISVTFINILGVRFGEIFSNVFTILKLTGIALIALIGVAAGSALSAGGTPPDSSPVPSSAAFAIAMIGVLWSYGGWHHASYISGEVRNAVRTVPRAMILGAGIVTLGYVLTNWAYLRMLPVDKIAVSQAVASDALSTALPSGAILIAVMIIVSTFGSIGIFTMTAPRIYYAMARDGRFFGFVARLHVRYKTPFNAILLQSGWALVLLFFWGTFENLITYVVFMDWVFMTLAAVSIFVYRKRLSRASYSVPGYPFIPLVFILISCWFIAFTLIGRPVQAAAAIVLLIVGLGAYQLNVRR